MQIPTTETKEVAKPASSVWFKEAIIYQLHLKTFCDSNNDGIGDFQGLLSKLDYLKNLGISAIWVLPFYPSPLKDDCYDISDYYSVNPSYGTLDDFRQFLQAAHDAGLRVITEMVLHHPSDQHIWFQRSRRAVPGDPWRDYYVWSDNPHKYSEARIIFKDTESSNWTFDPGAGSYFWHRFYSHQPDLNYDNPEVRAAMFNVVDFWLDMGVDGLRLDAVPYLFEREGTSCENLPETHAFLNELRRHVDRNFPNRMLLAEANQWPEDAVAYLAEGAECHMAFHFPLMPRIFMAVRMEDRFPITDIWAQTPPIHESSQWALFLRNHDELTREMVTDEERDYMYRAYAQESRMRLNLGIRRRLAPLLGNNRRAIELVHGLLFSLPGTPVLYYGDEIGMGDNVYLGDRDGVRTPMQWSGDRNAGFSRADWAQLYLQPLMDPVYGFQAVSVEAQLRTPNSLLRWLQRFIALRKEHPVFGLGTYKPLPAENTRIFAHIRSWEDDIVLCVHNLARSAQAVQLDLKEYAGMVPVEMLGRTAFPAIGELPYLLTLAPRGFFWFQLRQTEQVE